MDDTSLLLVGGGVVLAVVLVVIFGPRFGGARQDAPHGSDSGGAADGGSD